MGVRFSSKNYSNNQKNEEWDRERAELNKKVEDL